ncbi:MAG: MarR family transcriptional regulator [Pseudomonadota bacterium]
MIDRSSDGLGTQLRRLTELLDGELEALYRAEHPFYVPRFTPIMKALADGSPLSIKQIAERSSVSHSAASQTVARLKGYGLIETASDGDRRCRLVRLTDAGRDLLPWLRMKWRATTKAAHQLDAELRTPLSEVLAEAIARLEHRSFTDRIAACASKLEGETL